MLLAILFCANGASAQKISAEKALNKASIDAGTPVVISLRITNPFDSPVNVRIVDKNIFANNGLDIQCLEYAVPNKTTVEAAYPDITPYSGGSYTLDPATGEAAKLATTPSTSATRSSPFESASQPSRTDGT